MSEALRQTPQPEIKRRLNNPRANALLAIAMLGSTGAVIAGCDQIDAAIRYIHGSATASPDASGNLGNVNVTPSIPTDVKPGNTATPTPDGTKPVVTPTPTPEVTPTPEPTPTPRATIEKVHLKENGSATFVPFDQKPYYFLSIDDATVVAKEKDGESTWYAVTVAGNKVGGGFDTQGGGPAGTNKIVNVNMWYFTGTTFWVEIGPKTFIDTTSFQTLGRGPKVLAEHDVNVGETFPSVKIAFTYVKNGIGSYAEIQNNKESLARLENSMGDKIDRSDRRFSFFAGDVSVKP